MTRKQQQLTAARKRYMELTRQYAHAATIGQFVNGASHITPAQSAAARDRMVEIQIECDAIIAEHSAKALHVVVRASHV